MNIGQRLKQLRERKGLSQGDLEAVSGMLRCYISRVEHGHTVPSLDTLERFAAALDVPLYQLFWEGEDVPPTPNLTPRETIDNLADQAGSNGTEARLITMLRGLTSRMLEPDRRLLLDLASRLASR
jgi:transcriptional regulator with XRE-family HTH domain